MKRFLSVLMLVSGLLVAGGANAVPVTWTIPNTTLPNAFPSNTTVTSASISGTFVWDADTQTASSANVTVVINGASTLLTSTAANFSGYIVFNNSLTSGAPTGFVDYSSLTNAGGTVNGVSLIAGECTPQSGSCNSYNYMMGFGTLSDTAPTPPQPIPTLSEWAQIMMMLAMIATAGFYGWRMKQR